MIMIMMMFLYIYLLCLCICRGRDISGYNINAFTHINTYEAIVKFLSHPEQFSRVVQQLQLDVNDINTGTISKARDTFHRSNKK